MSSSAANSMPHMADRKAAVGTRLNALRIPEEHVAKVRRALECGDQGHTPPPLP